ncbi:MAG: hypothetical protein AAF709_14480 [Pseudomonadota bacterium]
MWSGYTDFLIEKLWLLVYLPHEDVPNLEWAEGAAAWLESSDWETVDISRLSLFHRLARAHGANVEGLDERFAAFFSSQASVDQGWFGKYVTESFETRTVVTPIELILWGADYIEDSERIVLRGLLRNRILSDDQAWASLNLSLLGKTKELCQRLEISPDFWANGVLVAVREMLQSSDLDPGQVGWMTNYLSVASKHVSVAREKQSLREYAWRQIDGHPSWLSSFEGNASSVVSVLDLCVSGDRESDRALIYSSIFLHEKRLAEIDVWQLLKLSRVARVAGVDQGVWSDWAELWMQHADSLQHGKLAEVLGVIQALPKSGAKADQAMAGLLDVVMQRLLIDPDWLSEADAKVLALAVNRTYALMDSMQRRTFAQAMTDRLAHGEDLQAHSWQLNFIASLFHSPELREMLRDALMNRRGRPRRNVGMVLTWAYAGQGEMHTWRAYLEEQAEASGTGAAGRHDRATWLLIRAEAGFSHLLPADTSGTTAIEWAEAAYSASADDLARCASTEWLIRAFVRRGDVDAAVGRVDRCLSQINDPDVRRALLEIRDGLVGESQFVSGS